MKTQSVSYSGRGGVGSPKLFQQAFGRFPSSQSHMLGVRAPNVVVTPVPGRCNLQSLCTSPCGLGMWAPDHILVMFFGSDVKTKFLISLSTRDWLAPLRKGTTFLKVPIACFSQVILSVCGSHLNIMQFFWLCFMRDRILMDVEDRSTLSFHLSHSTHQPISNLVR